MSAGRSSATGGRRRRRSPEVAEQEIIDAAEELLRERPFRELTVDEVMRRTELSRPSFYVYFRDRHHLVLKVVERLTAESADDGRRLVRGRGLWARRHPRGDRRASSRCSRSTAPCWRRSPTRRPTTPRSRRAYRGALNFFIDATARHIEGEIDGREHAALRRRRRPRGRCAS